VVEKRTISEIWTAKGRKNANFSYPHPYLTQNLTMSPWEQANDFCALKSQGQFLWLISREISFEDFERM